MGDARSLTPLSETDYEAIAAAVMETARGRWFMAEHAKRNRHADTAQVLAAIDRLQHAMGVSAAPASSGPDVSEAIALIMDLRNDLERISGKAGEPSSRLGARIETAAGSIIGATESIQEAAWGLRESGAAEVMCDLLDRRATEIYAASAIVEGTAQQIGKIADTIAMLDSSLRAIAGSMHAAAAPDTNRITAAPTPAKALDLREAVPLSTYDDIEIVEIDDKPRSTLHEAQRIRTRASNHRRLSTIQMMEEDLVFAEAPEAAGAVPAPKPRSAATTSEAELRKIEALPVDEKLAFFA